jgi:hypothetical protein
MDFSPLSPSRQVLGVEPGCTKDGMPNLPVGQDVILATMRSVASGTVSPEDALLSVRRRPGVVEAGACARDEYCHLRLFLRSGGETGLVAGLRLPAWRI